MLSMMKKVVYGLLLVALLASPSLALADYNSTVESSVRAQFATDPVMINIASCESQFHQFNTDGSVLRGGYKHTMIGIFQIAPLHLTEADLLGDDVNTIAGNIAYAQYLHDIYGTAPWLDSAHCWSKMSTSLAPSVQSLSSANPPVLAVPSDEAQSQQLTDLQFQITRLAAVINALIRARLSSGVTS